MEINQAIAPLSALSHATRLAIFRLLVQAEPDGMVAGDVATALSVKGHTLSNHLLILSTAGLIAARREGRSIRYRARLETMRDLLTFLMQDCCWGRPEDCAPVLAEPALIDAMIAHPVLVDRPIVASPRGVRLCPPSETVLDLLDCLPPGPLYKEDGAMILDAQATGSRLSTTPSLTGPRPAPIRAGSGAKARRTRFSMTMPCLLPQGPGRGSGPRQTT